MEVISIAELAERLFVNRPYARRLLDEGKLPSTSGPDGEPVVDRNVAELTLDVYCRLRGISRGERRRLELRRDVFHVDIDHRYYYPRELAMARGARRWRLTRVCRRLREWVSGWSRYDVVVGGHWDTLGGKTVVQSVHRPKAFRRALTIADGRSENWKPVSRC